MDSSQDEFQNSNSIWQAVAAVLIFLGLSLWIADQSPTPPSLKTAQASEDTSGTKEMATSTASPRKDISASPKDRAAAPLAPSPKRALSQIQSSKEVQALLKDPKNRLIEAETVEGLGVWTMKYQHLYNGIEVLGSMATYHSGPAGEKIRNHLKDVKVKTEPKLSATEAEKRALANVGNNSRASAAPELKILPSNRTQSAKLIYSIQIRDANSLPHEVWIDAHSGSMVSHMARAGESRETQSPQGKGTL